MDVIVIEDSRLAREGLIRMLRDSSEYRNIGQAACADSAISLIEENKPKCIFLDIHLPGGSGFDVLNSLSYVPKVIFTTAFSDYAIKAFDYNVIDYLLKPITMPRLKVALEKLKLGNADLSQNKELLPSTKLFFKNNEQCHLVTLANIDYFESCKNYARIYFDNDNTFVKKPLSDIELRLPKSLFLRVSRQIIVNLNSVTSIHETISYGYELSLKTGATIQITRRAAQELKDNWSL